MSKCPRGGDCTFTPPCERDCLAPLTSVAPYQDRVQGFMLACFGAVIALDHVERNHRFLEEALELVQSTGCTRSEAHQLVDYVFGRPVGEPAQEAGGVMVTLAALCTANEIPMETAGDMELDRCNVNMEKIRAKQAAKPKHGPLPQDVTQPIVEWHDDLGDVLWWKFPITEPPYCGSPLSEDWPGYHTHFTRITVPSEPGGSNAG